ncbi:MAG: hypothetical protein B6242_14460 [Anaerolineaceae bacterium 4572_78]|nr:MAG: hypothetical protein B6242_14460 [Anaerolineaceae bacterium 4572_78]
MNKLKFIFIMFIVIIFLVIIGLRQWLFVDLPHPDQLYQYTSAPSTNIYDRHGMLLYQISHPHQGYHTPLSIEVIPSNCILATIATEDNTFYQNAGFDTWAMMRALVTNLWHGEIVSGASTITQQLSRNLMFTSEERSEVSFSRKLREIILAWRLTQTYSKDEILTLYLNETYYGNFAHGLEAASTIYFGKETAELDLAECALLAGLPQSPIYYNPLENLATAQTRQHVVLDLMVEHGAVSIEEATLAKEENLRFAAIPFPIEAPHFVMHVRSELEERFGREAIYTEGLQVHTTLDLNMHNVTQQIVQRQLAKLNDPLHGIDHNIRNAGVVILKPQTGEIFTMLGSPDYFNRAIDGNLNTTVALRQPGSAIKPIAYATAFDLNFARKYGYKPLTPATMMMDVRQSYVTKEGDAYVPENYDRLWHGPVLLRHALASSFNLIAVKVLNHVGIEAMTHTARQMGITTFDNTDDIGLSLTLGGEEVKLLELSFAYALFVNGGHQIEPHTILKITNANGDVLYQYQPKLGKQVLDETTAYLITDILSDNFARASAFGENSPLRLKRPSAAKTGTTTNFRDNWTIGYTPDFVTGVWIGNTDNEPMKHVTGISGAAPIWHAVMTAIHKNLPVQSFIQPNRIITKRVCAVNGLLPSEGCQRTIEEKFIAGTQPTKVDTWHQRFSLDSRNGLLATELCSSEYVVKRWFIMYPVEAEAWMQSNNIRSAPNSYSPLCPSNSDNVEQVNHIRPIHTTKPIRFTSPDEGTVYQISPNIPIDSQKIPIAIQITPHVKPESVQVFVNGTMLMQDTQTMWQLTTGHYRFEAVGIKLDGVQVRTVVEIEVH